MKRSLLLMWCVALAALLAGSAANAQDFPSRPITILVGVAPGGVTDLATRAYAAAIARNTGWTVVVENRPVAGGAVAATAVQNAAPDGHTLLTVVGAHSTRTLQRRDFLKLWRRAPRRPS